MIFYEIKLSQKVTAGLLKKTYVYGNKEYILFLYREALDIDTREWNIQALRAKRKEHMPVVLTKEIIFHMNGIYKLMLKLLYGCDLRMNELLKLRIKDIDFGFSNVYIWDSKSQRDRIVPLPKKIVEDLPEHIYIYTAPKA